MSVGDFAYVRLTPARHANQDIPRHESLAIANSDVVGYILDILQIQSRGFEIDVVGPKERDPTRFDFVGPRVGDTTDYLCHIPKPHHRPLGRSHGPHPVPLAGQVVLAVCCYLVAAYYLACCGFPIGC